MKLFKNHPCNTCLVKPICNISCKKHNIYLHKELRTLDYSSKIARIFGSILAGSAAPICKLLYDHSILINHIIITWAGILLILVIFYNITAAILFKKSKYKLYKLSQNVLSEFEKIFLFPEFTRKDQEESSIITY